MKTALALTLAIISFGYLLPWAIAVGRGRTNTASIFVVNLFFGWTFIGWVVALTWSLAHDSAKPVVQ
jgi:hypothetical protein